jgi:hypothetical protein
VKSAHEWYLGVSFPYWYSVGQLQVESNCIWRTSLDGWGSVGYAQLTERFLPWLNEMFPNWKVKGHIDHFYAQAFLIKQLLRQVVCKKLWNVYQCYNRSCWKVNREAKKGKCVWEQAFKICEKQYAENVCVWMTSGGCKQWKSACEINYEYSLRVWQFGQRWKEGEERVAYW